MAGIERYVINMDFDGGYTGEQIKADPDHIADWIEAGFVSRVDERGERIVTLEAALAAGLADPDDPARVVTADDVAPAG